ncbi:MAG TPA: hydroxymethylglutaryl-CoA lyase [Desulfitobacteriaceae bacterium]|nr:hydroxymethylglutaryl-CoA lyase [Desulfitobacteriaceae bacterium]
MERMCLPRKVLIREVGPRDGLQNEKQLVTTADKIRFIQLLVKTGLKNIEVTSFVNPKAVPQMSDAEELWQLLPVLPDVKFNALAFNLNGVKRAIKAGVKTVVVNISASESMNHRHSNKSREESLQEMEEIIKFAATEKVIIRTDLSMVFGCPLEGKLGIDQISYMVDNLLKIGIQEITLADSAGLGNPRQVYEICREIRTRFPQGEFGLHIHDTKGLGMVNVLAGIQAGFEIIETSVGGLGGCPFIHKAAGNVPTEDVVYMLHEMGLDTGISIPDLLDAGYFISGILGRKLASRQAGICLG